MKTYQELDEFISKGRHPRDGRTLQNNTQAVRLSGGAIAVRLHSTDVLTFNQDGTVVLDSGGWLTYTTKDRINTYLPRDWSLYQERGSWYVVRHVYRDFDPATEDEPQPERVTYLFADGMTLCPDGTVMGAGKAPPKGEQARILRYVRAFMAEFRKGGMRVTGGDCWYCYMREEKTGAPLGEYNDNPDHIREHIAEKYYVPSLLARAVEVMPMGPLPHDLVLANLYNGEKLEGNLLSICVDQATRALRRYIRRELGYPA